MENRLTADPFSNPQRNWTGDKHDKQTLLGLGLGQEAPAGPGNEELVPYFHCFALSRYSGKKCFDFPEAGTSKITQAGETRIYLSLLAVPKMPN